MLKRTNQSGNLLVRPIIASLNPRISPNVFTLQVSNPQLAFIKALKECRRKEKKLTLRTSTTSSAIAAIHIILQINPAKHLTKRHG